MRFPHAAQKGTINLKQKAFAAAANGRGYRLLPLCGLGFSESTNVRLERLVAWIQPKKDLLIFLTTKSLCGILE
jgi:hypothetical protein